MTKIVIFLTIRYSMGHIFLTNFEETFESSFKATFGESIFLLLLIINNLCNLHHMSEGKTEKCESIA